MHEIDISALVSALMGGVAVYAGIKADLAVLKVRVAELKRRFDAHESKSEH